MLDHEHASAVSTSGLLACSAVPTAWADAKRSTVVSMQYIGPHVIGQHGTVVRSVAASQYIMLYRVHAAARSSSYTVLSGAQPHSVQS